MTSTPAESATAVDSDEAPKKAGASREIFELGKTIFYALLIALVLRIILFQPFTIPSASMEPNLYEGDYIVVSKFAYGWSRHSIPFSPPIFHGRILARQPQRGDIVVFKLPRDNRTDYIKRLIGLPGDRIQVKGGQVWLNGKPIPRTPAGVGDASCAGPFVTPGVQRYRETLPSGKSYLTNDCVPVSGDADNTAIYTVPTDCYFMMGDNRDNSADSRFPPDVPGGVGEQKCGWNHALDASIRGAGYGQNFGVGFVPAENLVGRADIVLFSWKPGASLLKPWTWFTDARVGRFFHLLG